MDSKVLKALKRQLDNSAPTEMEEYQYPDNPRNLLLEKLGLPRALGVSRADEKRWTEDYPRLATEGSTNVAGPAFSKLQQLLGRGEPAISKPIISPAAESLVEDLKAGRSFTKLPSRTDIEQYINPGPQPVKTENVPEELADFLRRRTLQKAEQRDAKFLDEARENAIESGSGEAVTAEIIPLKKRLNNE